LKEGSGNRATMGILEGYVMKLLNWASLSIGTPLGDHGGDAA